MNLACTLVGTVVPSHSSARAPTSKNVPWTPYPGHPARRQRPARPARPRRLCVQTKWWDEFGVHTRRHGRPVTFIRPRSNLEERTLDALDALDTLRVDIALHTLHADIALGTLRTVRTCGTRGTRGARCTRGTGSACGADEAEPEGHGEPHIEGARDVAGLGRGARGERCGDGVVRLLVLLEEPVSVGLVVCC
jgi:hypothetical protein